MSSEQPARATTKRKNGGKKNGPRVLVVYKKSALQTNVRERKNEHITKLVEAGHRSVSRMREAHDAHVGTLEETKDALDALGVRSSFRFRGDDELVEEFDLVVTVGGDGTLLWAARWVGAHTPVVAINSAPGDSVGHFCAGLKGDVKTTLAAAIEGELRAARLTRMMVTIDGEVVSRRILNDALFSHVCPAATSRYLVTHQRGDGAVSEEHKSSGVWIGPAAGSTAAQLSAGGRVLPPQSRRLQFVVREPYLPPEGSYQLVRGLVEPEGAFEVVSKMREARVYLDGPHQAHDVRWGTHVRFERSEDSLQLLGFPRGH